MCWVSYGQDGFAVCCPQTPFEVDAHSIMLSARTSGFVEWSTSRRGWVTGERQTANIHMWVACFQRFCGSICLWARSSRWTFPIFPNFTSLCIRYSSRTLKRSQNWLFAPPCRFWFLTPWYSNSSACLPRIHSSFIAPVLISYNGK